MENVLEGSVRRAGNRVLVNVQLIDARDDRHIWAQRYDRTIADSIGLQGELATQIAQELRATLAPEEKARLAAKPTNDPEAYALYLKALGQERSVNFSPADYPALVKLYTEAIKLDPRFALAHARLSIIYTKLSFSPPMDQSLKEKARAEAAEALRLSPTLGEAHAALGLYWYQVVKDYNTALREFSAAAATTPNETDILGNMARIYRRQGRWRESLTTFARARELDPRNVNAAFSEAHAYLLVRDWPAATAGFNRALEIAPDAVDARIGLAYLEVFRNANPAAGRKIVGLIPKDIDPDGNVTLARFDLAMLERDYAAAEKILVDFPLHDFPRPEDAPKEVSLGRVALAKGDIEAAHRYFAAAAPAMEGWVLAQPDDVFRISSLAMFHAYMHRKEEAIREAKRALELDPESQNAFHGATYLARLALVYALVGEPDQAIPLIEQLLSKPGPVQCPDFPDNITLADLRLRWEWDSLRNDPRFQKILAAPEPKTSY